MAGTKQLTGLGITQQSCCLPGESSQWTLALFIFWQLWKCWAKRVFQDASVTPGFFQYSGSCKALVDKTAHGVTTLGWSIICLRSHPPGRGSYWVTKNICVTTKLEQRHQSQHPNVAPQTSNRHTERLVLTFFAFSDGRKGPTGNRSVHQQQVFP